MLTEKIRMIGRGAAVWLLIIAAEFVHGALRVFLLEPLIGDFRARQAAVLTGILIVLAISYLFVRRIRAQGDLQLFFIGLMWLVLTAAFEITLGRVLNQSWERILSDYDLARGGLLGFGLLSMVFAPMIAARLRNRLARRRAG